MANNVKVIENPDGEPIGVEIIADAIVRLAAGIKRVNASGLNRRAVITLLQDSTRNLARYDIAQVLDALDALEKNYVDAKPKPAGRKK